MSSTFKSALKKIKTKEGYQTNILTVCGDRKMAAGFL